MSSHLERTSASLSVADKRRPLAHRFYQFNHYIENATFSVSCDAFANLKVRGTAAELSTLINLTRRKH